MSRIELNHIWIVVDRPTYEAITNSEFFKAFAYSYEQQNSADGQTGWEGFYIRGKHTYIEIFYPQERYKMTGLAGIGLGCDTQGNLKKFFADSFEKQFPEAQYNTFKRQNVPWFNYVAVHGSYYGDGHSFWIMEYAPEYFQENKHDVSRKHYNAQSYDPNKPLLDITKFSITLTPADQKILSAYLTSVGMVPSQKNTFLNKSGVTINMFDESPTQKGIYEIVFSLNTSPQAAGTHTFGHSELTIEGTQATWRFFKR